MTHTIRLAKLIDVEAVQKLAQQHSTELGFVMKTMLRESVMRGGLLVAVTDDQVIGFANTNRRKDGTTVLYELAVAKEYRNLGIAKELLSVAGLPLLAKCPVTLPSNKFYMRAGFRLLRTEPGRKQSLNVWQLG